MNHFFDRLQLGIDVVEISRFKGLKKKGHFLRKMFTKEELAYCFSYKDYAPHLAGTFAAKEAVLKAFGGEGMISDIEIKRAINGKPLVWVKHRYKKSIAISISHADVIAVAMAVKK